MYEKELQEITLEAKGNKSLAINNMEDFLAGKGLDKERRQQVMLEFIAFDHPEMPQEDIMNDKLEELDLLHKANAEMHTKLAILAMKIEPKGIDESIKQQKEKLEQGKRLLELAEMAMSMQGASIIVGMDFGNEKR